MPSACTSARVLGRERRTEDNGTNRLKLFEKPLVLNLALQGGGAHGAFTWGVLDRLLEEPQLKISWISGTSAGAVNAVALACGLAIAGNDGARAKLRKVWEGVHKAGVPDLMRMNPFLYSLSRSPTMAQMASLLSPYEFNPLGFDPLRRLLAETIDFAALRTAPGPELVIAATDVATGRPRFFRRRNLAIEQVLASCCLPTLHHSVEIEGRAYWDGGFSSNPDLVNVAGSSPAGDTLVVLVNPFETDTLPTGAREISGHANRLTFNAPFLRDVEVIETAREAMTGLFRPRRGRLVRLARHRFHVIEAARYTSTLSHDSKLKPDINLLNYLHGAGRTEASQWLDRHRSDVGRRATVDLKRKFLDRERAPLPAPVPLPAPQAPIIAKIADEKK